MKQSWKILNAIETENYGEFGQYVTLADRAAAREERRREKINKLKAAGKPIPEHLVLPSDFVEKPANAGSMKLYINVPDVRLARRLEQLGRVLKSNRIMPISAHQYFFIEIEVISESKLRIAPVGCNPEDYTVRNRLWLDYDGEFFNVGYDGSDTPFHSVPPKEIQSLIDNLKTTYTSIWKEGKLVTF